MNWLIWIYDAEGEIKNAFHYYNKDDAVDNFENFCLKARPLEQIHLYKEYKNGSKVLYDTN